MTDLSIAGEAFAAATMALVRQSDVASILADLLVDYRRVVGADAAGLLLVPPGTDNLELASATSHAASELELYQLQHDSGPCLEAVRTGRAVEIGPRDDLAERWTPVGAAIAAAGFVAVHAYPLEWRGEVLGALNSFFRGDPDPDLGATSQAFANIATLTVTRQFELSAADVGQRIDGALRGRIVIEQAKGVLAYREGIGTDEAYELLRAHSAERELSLTAAAERVIADARNSRH